MGISKSAIASREMSGTLVLGNSTLDDTWRGQISGLAIYRGALTPEQVRKHFQSWTSVGAPSLTGDLPATALYLFDERAGDTVHNRMSTDTDLTIPAKYFVLHQAFLRSTWAQYANTWEIWTFLSFWEDIALNVFGFMPVGFVFFAYFSSVKPIARPALVTILLGLFLSFTVEALQSLLPTRDSGMTDLFTNTAGTALGVLLYQSGWLRRRTSRPLCRNIF